MAKKVIGVQKVVETKDGKVKKVVVGEIKQPSRAAQRSEGGRHGDFQKDGLGSRIADALLKKAGR